MKSTSSFSSAVLLRFVPALIVVYGLIDSVLTIAEPRGFTAASLLALGIELAGLTIGYAAILSAFGAADLSPGRRCSARRAHQNRLSMSWKRRSMPSLPVSNRVRERAFG